jgi:hypothetical protein
MISVPSAMQFMHERWWESLTPKSKTTHSLTVVMLTNSLRRVTWRHVLSLKDFTYSIIIERTPLRYHNMMKPHTVKYQRNSLGSRKRMVVGQQKLKWLEFQYNSNTKMKLRKELWWNSRHANHRNLDTDICGKAMWIPANVRHVKLRKLTCKLRKLSKTRHRQNWIRTLRFAATAKLITYRKFRETS